MNNSTVLDDGRIVELFFARSEDAIGALTDKYGEACHRLAYQIVSNVSDAEECVNDAYLGVWNTVPPTRPDPLSSYLYKIVRNLSIKRYRHNTAKKRNSHYDLALDELAECIPHRETAETKVAAKELGEAINRFLATLDQESRVLFVRRYWYADSPAMLGKRFRITAHHATVRLSRIRQKLKDYLSDQGFMV